MDSQYPESCQTFSQTLLQATNCLENEELDCAQWWDYLRERTGAGHRRVHRSVANAATLPTG